MGGRPRQQRTLHKTSQKRTPGSRCGASASCSSVIGEPLFRSHGLRKAVYKNLGFSIQESFRRDILSSAAKRALTHHRRMFPAGGFIHSCLSRVVNSENGHRGEPVSSLCGEQFRASTA